MTPLTPPIPASVFTLAFEWGNLIPLLLVALAVIYQIVRGLSEATRGRSEENEAAESSESSATPEDRLRELAERRRRQLRELAEQRRGSESPETARRQEDNQPAPRRTETAAEDRARAATTANERAASDQPHAPTPPPPPTASDREAGPPRESTMRGQPTGQPGREHAQGSRETVQRNASGTERERQRRLREAAAHAKKTHRQGQTSPYGSRKSGGKTMPQVRKPAPLVSSRKEITTGEIGAGPATEAPGKKKIGHAAWVRQLIGASPHELQRAIVLKEVFDVPVGLRNQQWTSPPSGD